MTHRNSPTGRRLTQFDIEQQPIDHDEVLMFAESLRSYAIGLLDNKRVNRSHVRGILLYMADGLYALGTLGFSPVNNHPRIGPEGLIELSEDDLPEHVRASYPSGGRVFSYHCRGRLKEWPIPKYLREEAGSLCGSRRVRHQSQPAGAFVDAPQYQATPLLKRPQARQLDSQLREGDQVLIALSEFTGAVEAGEVICAWEKRGVHFHVTDLPEECSDNKLLFGRILARFIQANEPWAGECESAEEGHEEGEGPAKWTSPI